ncbi:hypothetical protein K457DRAFT_142131 [Linnemannia elongata AG-77]|uniref:Uncharacterized protein n=1 Tax=Linnemannia elongata AG-77 TaxID=1314771 RepID=A0A197JG28_9FUNG|nr:hypothetical protein K457DRAFT_142131 [Linnemannia elongata AG-77]
MDHFKLWLVLLFFLSLFLPPWLQVLNYQPFLTLLLTLSFPPNPVIASSLLTHFSLLLFPIHTPSTAFC